MNSVFYLGESMRCLIFIEEALKVIEFPKTDDEPIANAKNNYLLKVQNNLNNLHF